MHSVGNRMLKIAKVLKSNGTDGDVIISFTGILPEDIDIEEPVFIYFDGLPVPFFIESFTRRGTGKALVRLTGIGNLADAEEIAGKAVYIPDDPDTGINGFSSIIGWSLYDSNHNEVGIISDFFDIPGNPCIEAGTVSGTVLIPLHEDLVISIDEENKILTMTIPEGLV